MWKNMLKTVWKNMAISTGKGQGGEDVWKSTGLYRVGAQLFNTFTQGNVMNLSNKPDAARIVENRRYALTASA